MQRRLFLKKGGAHGAGIAALLCGTSALIATPAMAQPSYTVSADQLQQAVATRFPMQYPLGGLATLKMQAPTLRLIPEANRLGALMAVDVAGPALRNSYAGGFDVDFALRYEASDQTLRAYQLRFNSLKLNGLPPGPSALIEAYGPSMAAQSLQEVTVHKLKPQDLALADTMGLEPGDITVTDKGLVVNFVNKK